tara:strand:- start:2702 stop:3127 length:426 start_codon:yes stop_codon:yes gene_type:complete
MKEDTMTKDTERFREQIKSPVETNYDKEDQDVSQRNRMLRDAHGPPSGDQTNTPAVAATGSTTVWANGPMGPPEIAQALVELSQGAHDMCDLDVIVKLGDGSTIDNVTFAEKHGDSTEIRTDDTTRHVVTTRIVELEYSTI